MISKLLKITALTGLAISSTLVFANHQKVTWVTEAGYEPYEYYDKNGKLAGFDIELYQAICKKMNWDCKMEITEFDAIIPGILYKKYDVAIAGMSVTEARKKIVNFTNVYLDPEAIIWLTSTKSKFTDPKEFKNTATQNGTTALEYLKGNGYPRIKGYDKFGSIILDIEAGRIDGLAVDAAVAKELLNKFPDLKVIGDKIFDPEIGQGMGMAVNKKNPQLLADLNKAIDELKSDGTFDKLKAKFLTPKSE